MTQGTCQLQPGELVQVHVEGLLQPAGGVPADQVLLPRLTKTKVSNKLARISPRITEDKRSLWIFIAGNKDSPTWVHTTHKRHFTWLSIKSSTKKLLEY